MKYSLFERDFFLELVDAMNRPGNRGIVEITPDPAPASLERIALENLEKEGLIEIRSSYNDGRKLIAVTGKGLSTAEALRAPQPPKNPIGFSA